MNVAVRSLTMMFLVLAGVSQSAVHAADYTVTVDAGQNKPLTEFMQGYLHGFQPTETLDSTLVGTNLQPEFWRLGFGGWDKYPKIAPFGPRVTMVISDMYADAKGGYSNAKPWLNWTEWEQFCAAQVSLSISQGKPVEYWDVWNEPDTSQYWSGTWAQLLETYQRAYDAIKSVDPDAKVIGPGTTEFAHPFDTNNSKNIADFVYELSRPPYNVRLDAVSWHELGSLPSSLPSHAQLLRDFFADPTYFSPAYVTELHVNEYSQPNNTQIPGWIVGWLYYAEQADLDWFSRACWNMWENIFFSYSNCLQGLNGVFMRDLVTPQQPYYVYKTYADVAAGTRIVTSSTNAEVNALASKFDANSKVLAMVGVHNKSGASSVDVQFTNFPYSSTGATVTVRKLVNNNVLDGGQNPKAQAGVAPTVTFSGNVAISGGAFTVNINPFANGEMYVIEAVPAVTGPPGAATNPSPAWGATGVNYNADLTWTAGAGATSHDVYFGTTNPPPFKQNQSGTTYDPGSMLGNQLYYWRIDEKNGVGTTTGTVWNFTTGAAPQTLYQPDGASTIQGSHLGGNLASCLSDDNNFFVSGSHNAPAAQFNFTIVQARAEVTQLRAKVRSKDSFGLGVTRYVYLWNYDTSSWESLASNSVNTSESELQVTVTSNPGRFVGNDKVVKMAVQHDLFLFQHSQSVEYVQLGVNGG